MAKYYCILFDVDNTLLDFNAAEAKALADTLEQYGITADEETKAKYKSINEALWRQLEKGQLKREKLFAERFSRFLAELGLKGSGAEMNKYYLEQLSANPDEIPGVHDVLDELAEVATLAIVSNGVEFVQTRRIRESGLIDYMEDVFISEKMGVEKPNRKIYDMALRRLGIEDASHVLVVGDGLTSDVKGGINAKLTTCWYNPLRAENDTDIHPDYEIHDLRELFPIVMEEDELSRVGNKNRNHMA